MGGGGGGDDNSKPSVGGCGGKIVSKFLTNFELDTRLDGGWCQRRFDRHAQLLGTSGMKHRTVGVGHVASVDGGVQLGLS
jgi:hypothetical protein